MRYILFSITIVLFSVNGYSQAREDIFSIKPSMIESFDPLTFEIKLTESAINEISKEDFSKYSYIWVSNTHHLIPIIDDKSAIRLQEIFIYKKGNSIPIKADRLVLQAKHLSLADCRVQELKRVFHRNNYYL